MNEHLYEFFFMHVQNLKSSLPLVKWFLCKWRCVLRMWWPCIASNELIVEQHMPKISKTHRNDNRTNHRFIIIIFVSHGIFIVFRYQSVCCALFYFIFRSFVRYNSGEIYANCVCEAELLV